MEVLPHLADIFPWFADDRVQFLQIMMCLLCQLQIADDRVQFLQIRPACSNESPNQTHHHHHHHATAPTNENGPMGLKRELQRRTRTTWPILICCRVFKTKTKIYPRPSSRHSPILSTPLPCPFPVSFSLPFPLRAPHPTHTTHTP